MKCNITILGISLMNILIGTSAEAIVNPISHKSSYLKQFITEDGDDVFFQKYPGTYPFEEEAPREYMYRDSFGNLQSAEEDMIPGATPKCRKWKIISEEPNAILKPHPEEPNQTINAQYFNYVCADEKWEVNPKDLPRGIKYDTCIEYQIVAINYYQYTNECIKWKYHNKEIRMLKKN